MKRSAFNDDKEIRQNPAGETNTESLYGIIPLGSQPRAMNLVNKLLITGFS